MRIILFALLYIVASTLQAHDIIYSKTDSIFITGILQEHTNREIPAQNLILSIAEKFIGNRYTAGTLEKSIKEPLVINCTEVDCTTFVELALAIYATIKEGNSSFNAVTENLEKIRYRHGRREGYASRLHYMSQWIADTTKQHLVTENTYCKYSKKQLLNLNFMSTHPANYKILNSNKELITEIEKEEKPFRKLYIDYIPKEELKRGKKELPIKDGDIIVLTTNIEGLDVLHTGFAFWKNNKIHLLHASSAEGKVTKEERPLYDYLKNKKRHTGIRIFSIK